MEQIFSSKQNGWILHIQDSSNGGWDYTLFDASMHEIDGGFLETDNLEYDTPITLDIVELVMNDVAIGHPDRDFILSLSWEVDTKITREMIDNYQQKDLQARLAVYDYENYKHNLSALHERLKSIFGNIKEAAIWIYLYRPSLSFPQSVLINLS